MKIVKDKTHNVWFTSDTHYSHRNIVSGVTEWKGEDRTDRTRKFDTVPEMNDMVVNSINEVVLPDDTLVHLGDWSFGGIEQIWELRKRIKCKNIILVYGNHDHHIRTNKVLPNCHYDTLEIETIKDGKPLNTYNDYRDDLFNVCSHDLFNWVGDYLELSIVDNSMDGKNGRAPKYNMICTHYPMASWDRLGKGMIHLHGHIHTPPENIFGPGKMMDVGMDGNNFRPWPLYGILDLMKKRPIKSLLTHVYDHHLNKDVY